MVDLAGSGTHVDRRLAELGRRCIPPDPTAELRPPVVVPALARDSADVEDLVQCYREEMRRRTGRESFAYANGQVPQKPRRSISACLAVLRAENIPPAAWCIGSLEQWDVLRPYSAPTPRVAWVWSASRASAGSLSRTWFEEHRGEYCKPRLLVVRPLAELRMDWERMWDVLRALRPDTQEELRKLVDGYFPGQAYARRLAASRTALYAELRVGLWVER